MREYAAPLSTTIPTTGNLTDDVVANAREAGQTAVFSRRTADGWTDVTAEQFHDEVRSVAKGLVAAGVEISSICIAGFPFPAIGRAAIVFGIAFQHG